MLYEVITNFRKNASIILMIMRDKVRDSLPEKDMRDKEHHMRSSLHAYFSAMRRSGTLSVEPEIAMKFFMTIV